jgi:hypothetical protein
MTDQTTFQTVFAMLKKVLQPYVDKLVISNDVADEFYLNTPFIMQNKKNMYFGSVKINKNYVSFHLMPVYVFPELLNELKPNLLKHMQGKSCFNFKTSDTDLFNELSALVERGFVKYQSAGFI